MQSFPLPSLLPESSLYCQLSGPHSPTASQQQAENLEGGSLQGLDPPSHDLNLTSAASPRTLSPKAGTFGGTGWGSTTRGGGKRQVQSHHPAHHSPHRPCMHAPPVRLSPLPPVRTNHHGGEPLWEERGRWDRELPRHCQGWEGLGKKRRASGGALREAPAAPQGSTHS